MNRSVLVGVCSGAVGIVLGLLIAALVEPTLGQVRGERDRLSRELDEARAVKQRIDEIMPRANYLFRPGPLQGFASSLRASQVWDDHKLCADFFPAAARFMFDLSKPKPNRLMMEASVLVEGTDQSIAQVVLTSRPDSLTDRDRVKERFLERLRAVARALKFEPGEESGLLSIGQRLDMLAGNQDFGCNRVVRGSPPRISEELIRCMIGAKEDPEFGLPCEFPALGFVLSANWTVEVAMGCVVDTATGFGDSPPKWPSHCFSVILVPGNQAEFTSAGNEPGAGPPGPAHYWPRLTQEEFRAATIAWKAELVSPR